MTNRLSRHPLFIFLMFCAIVCLIGGFVQRKTAASSLTRTQAIADVKAAIGKRDFRFVTLRTITIVVPPIVDGAYNSFVVAHGKKPPIGVGDYIRNADEMQKQNSASEYATAYNSFLLEYLLNHPDAKTKLYFQKVDQELQKFQKANARNDALQSFRSTPRFLCVEGARENGFPLDDSRASWIDVQWLEVNPSLLRGQRREVFDRMLKSYVIPYNQTLYKLLQQKWKKQGIKNRAA